MALSKIIAGAAQPGQCVQALQISHSIAALQSRRETAVMNAPDWFA